MASRTRVQRLLFGGVAFELLLPGCGDRLVELAPEWASFARSMERELPAVAHASCSVVFDAALVRAVPEGVTNDVRWAPAVDGGLRIEARHMRAHARHLAAGRYAVSVAVEASHEGALALLRGVAGALVCAEGGVLFHAAAVEFNGGAILLLGPSGAGKSTAAGLLPGARCLSFDHVAVVPGPDGRWNVWGLPGGSAAGVEASAHVVLPLRAILRVRRGRPRPEVVPLCGADALFALRESLELADFSPDAEDASLDVLMALARDTPVGAVYTVLGESWADALRASPVGGRAFA